MADNDIAGATTRTPEAAYPGSTGEFAADWNAWDEPRREQFLTAMVRAAQEASRCFIAGHDALLTEVHRMQGELGRAHARTTAAYSEGWQAALTAVTEEMDRG